jgi:hypothetical protein
LENKIVALFLIPYSLFLFPLQSGIIASAEVELEYDSQPNTGDNKTDTTYRLKIGYQW